GQQIDQYADDVVEALVGADHDARGILDLNAVDVVEGRIVTDLDVGGLADIDTRVAVGARRAVLDQAVGREHRKQAIITVVCGGNRFQVESVRPGKDHAILAKVLDDNVFQYKFAARGSHGNAVRRATRILDHHAIAQRIAQADDANARLGYDNRLCVI